MKFRVIKLVQLPQKSIKGTDFTCIFGDYVTKAKYPTSVKEKWFPSNNTLLLGVSPDPARLPKGGAATWKFNVSDIPLSSSRKLVSANLSIVTTRVHAGIHMDYDTRASALTLDEINDCLPYEKLCIDIEDKGVKQVKLRRGHVYINERYFDNIDLVPKMPTGRYHGFNKLDPYPISEFIIEAQKNEKELSVKLEVDDGVYWDIDEVVIDSIVLEEKCFADWVVNTFFMIIGAVISAGFGIIAQFL